MSYELIISRWEGFSILKIAKDDAVMCVEKDMIEFIQSLDLSGKNVVDGGSNIGLASLVLSEAVGEGLVYAFELQRLVYQIGCANIILNGRQNVIAFNNPLSDCSGKMLGFTNIDYDGKNVSTVGVKTESDNGSIDYYDRAKSIALDDLNIQNIGLIKLDLEGHEPEALNGMWQSIDKWKPYLIIELSVGYLGDRVPLIIEQIEAHGYRVREASEYNYFAEPI